MPTKKQVTTETLSTDSSPPEVLRQALNYAKKIIQSYEADVKAGAWTGVNLEAVGFCQGDIYKDALATIDRIARGELVV